jgi:hypothetical protein
LLLFSKGSAGFHSFLNKGTKKCSFFRVIVGQTTCHEHRAEKAADGGAISGWGGRHSRTPLTTQAALGHDGFLRGF